MVSERGKETILIVDDNPTNLGVLFEALDQIGFKVLIAESGEKALKTVNLHQPDLIILDIIMPMIDGFETCRRLKKKKNLADVPIIFMTALSDTKNKVKGFASGGVDYITKPFHKEEVLARVKTHLMIRQQQYQLAEQKKKLHELNVSKDRFFSILAHDLKNPFHAFVLNTELLIQCDKFSRQEIKSLATKLNRSANQLNKLLDNLLNWASIQMGTLRFKPERCQLLTIVDTNLYLLESNLSQKQINVINMVSEDVFVNADPDIVHTILRNLLTNAYKFTPRGGEIQIFTKDTDQFVAISIMDNGIGIDEEHIKKLFQLDQKYYRRGTESEKSTGLGLILCKELVEKHDGHIWVESDVDCGSTFTFTLPKYFEQVGC